MHKCVNLGQSLTSSKFITVGVKYFWKASFFEEKITCETETESLLNFEYCSSTLSTLCLIPYVGDQS
jgi:hypothetical protein